ncbi:FUSC family protein [Arsenicibacter rosenii]|uniref:Uncharacterized protein n=1 Tax=Arsenicibacter rosenii TaxID=1750698 RepID=A0A1S2VDG1_9BACT|nr:FUSC family membrane protein [Arsenicibacter rosenii]OIN56743.1 hypothetical protein BLX24_23485 [Arsenicibacter rosenii]
MKKQVREVRYFLFGQHFSDGLRITLAILIPSVVLAQFGHFQLGMMVSMGALCVSIADSPGPVIHKRNGMLVCWGLIVLVALLTGFLRASNWTLGPEILVFSFLFSMFGVYGNRATAIGTAGLLIMILMMDRPLTYTEVWQYAGLIALGGFWYLAISLSSVQLLPYRAAQQALGECVHAISKFLLIKAEFYNTSTDLEEDYRKLLAQQVTVSEKQDAVRELLFKSRQIVKESTSTGRVLVLTFVDVIDLYEQIVAMYYDYASIRERFGHTGVLRDISRLIRRMAIELDYIGLSIQSNRPHKGHTDLTNHLEALRLRIEDIGKKDPETSNLVLRKLLVSLRNLHQRLYTIQQYADPNAKVAKEARYPDDFNRFISHQEVDPKMFVNNLTLNSSIFRHSLRMALACMVGFIVAKSFPLGHHSYWILLTITVLIKPGYSLTKQRNYERLTGTLVGGGIGTLILLATGNTTVLFLAMLMFMIGAFSFQRTNYVVMVTLMTPYLLILFHFLGMGGFGILEERVLDTVVGSVIAFAASFLLFPRWESDQLKPLLVDVVKANIAFLKIMSDGLSGKSISITEYKLARKDVYVSSANLAAAFQRMTSEPSWKQWHRSEVHQFVVLNHILSSNVATITSTLATGSLPKPATADGIRLVKRSLASLTESLRKLNAPVASTPATAEPQPETVTVAKVAPTADDRLLRGQLEFIQKVSFDVGKVTDTLLV